MSQPMPLANVFAFLRKNRRWNQEFQEQEYVRNLSHSRGSCGWLMNLLHMTVNTQSAPKLDKLGDFWRFMDQFKQSNPSTRKEFIDQLEGGINLTLGDVKTWERLFRALRAQPGWGDKTAALFVKSAIKIHRGPKELHFWSDLDVDVPIDPEDKIYLPVDAVIKHVFESTGLISRPSFRSVNCLLMDHYDPEEMLLWDDLWFWGYFTQNSQEKNRTMSWNRNKFWCQPSSPTSDESEIKILCEEFIDLIKAAKAT